MHDDVLKLRELLDWTLVVEVEYGTRWLVRPFGCRSGRVVGQGGKRVKVASSNHLRSRRRNVLCSFHRDLDINLPDSPLPAYTFI
jgi:hypothetical protein